MKRHMHMTTGTSPTAIIIPNTLRTMSRCQEQMLNTTVA